MIKIKTTEEIEIMKISGRILAETLYKVLENVKPGISEEELDKMAEDLIVEKGAQPGFKKVPGYKHTICVSVNDVVVHGVPSGYRLKPGDIIGIDCGAYYKGFHTDMSETVIVEDSKLNLKNDEVNKFLNTGKKALEEGIKAAKLRNHVGDISKTIQDIVEGQGYSVVRSLVGHGVGRDLHEEPEVPGYLMGSIDKTPILKEGMVIAVEVIYNMGKSEVTHSNTDNWTIKTEDGSLSGVFERTVAITKSGTVVLT